ncbi:MAG: hypothetical protein ABJQ14_01040, partial [Hyphomicrobiales bacterium]
DTIVGTMKASLGDKLVARTMNRRMETLGDSRKSASLVPGAGIGLTTQKAAASKPVPNNDFFGD